MPKDIPCIRFGKLEAGTYQFQKLPSIEGFHAPYLHIAHAEERQEPSPTDLRKHCLIAATTTDLLRDIRLGKWRFGTHASILATGACPGCRRNLTFSISAQKTEKS